MKRNIASQFAVGIILLIAITIGGIFWLNNKKLELQNEYYPKNIAKKNRTIDAQVVGEQKKPSQQIEDDLTCIPHYYEGEATIQGWPVQPLNGSEKELAIQIKNQDIEKLPTTKVDSLQPKFIVTIVDPTEQNREDLKNATEKNPVNLTVHGYAHICQSMPRVSIKQATIAFKKS